MGSNFTNCSSNGVTSVPATVTNNGCDYVFEATKKSLARTSVKCAKATEQIEVHIYENETRHKENKPLCTYDLKPQGPATGIEIEHIEIGTKKESLVLHFNLKFAVTSTLGNVAVCGVGAPPAETMVTLTGDYLLAGFNGALLTPIMIE